MTGAGKVTRLSLAMRLLVPVLVILGAVSLVFALAGADQEMKCYSKGFDHDGDGWAGLQSSDPDTKTAYRQFSFSGGLRLNCPAGYVKFIDDCNDRDENVHPKHAEVGFNAHDDDCDGVTDEPMFEARPNTTSSFRFQVDINSQAALDHASELFAQVSYASLADSDNLRQTGKFAVHPSGNRHTVQLAVSNLAPLTAYRAQVTFLTRDGNGNYQPIGPVLADSDWHYTITDGQGAEGRTRATIIERGFAEYRASNQGMVGYRGTVDPDGTRYGADRDEAWCTEFYVWVTKTNLRRMAGRDSWDEMIEYFRNARSFLPETQLATAAVPGDYLVMDTDGDGKKNHSGMFLAYEASHDRAWTLEGNSGNAVKVAKRKTEIRGIGHLPPDRLTNLTEPPPPAVGVVMPAECKEIRARITSLERDRDRWQARLDRASPSMKADLARRIRDLNSQIETATNDYRRCLARAR